MITQFGSHGVSDVCSHFKIKKGQLIPPLVINQEVSNQILLAILFLTVEMWS